MSSTASALLQRVPGQPVRRHQGDPSRVMELHRTRRFAASKPYAMRVVADDGYNRMAIEIGALMKLEKMGASHFLKVIDSGFAYCPRSERFFSFMVTPMCGPNPPPQPQSRKGNKFSLACSINIGIQVIEALRQLHDAGFIHCDVKGSNLVPGLEPTPGRSI
ncbi:hypothetical protein L596_025705 [Steinernema carpocapsae]|uniref:Protein kinase domain-containing protein n=1 Tax=Steinernema carpocapsae TaxID=34508 RepID=A0A4U5M8L0_STECR|nr:hypothetical protein L596_025705 [Steinernema carpocapsae]